MMPAYRRLARVNCGTGAAPASARVQVLGWDKTLDTYIPQTLWRAPQQAPSYVLEWDQVADTYSYQLAWRPTA